MSEDYQAPSGAEHPITPPPELFRQWEGMPRSLAFEAAYRAGADQELKACCEWLTANDNPRWSVALQEGRRPKPPSLADQALKELTDWTEEKHGSGGEVFLCEGLSVIKIRRALKRLQELEGANG